jgi:hypothetical protein
MFCYLFDIVLDFVRFLLTFEGILFNHFYNTGQLYGVPIISDLLEHFATLSLPVHWTPAISVNRCSSITAHQNENKNQ